MSEPNRLTAEISQARRMLASLEPRQLRDGTWFHTILQRSATRLVEKQRRRALASPLRRSHPDLDDAALAELTIRRAARRTSLIGGTAGATITALELGSVASLGVSTTTAFAVAMAELAVLERMQVEMIFGLAELHGVRLDTESFRQIGALYAHVLKVKGTSRAAAWTRAGTMALFRTVGLRFVQRAALKYAVPLVSVGVGGGLNYLMTRALGRHTIRQFKRAERTAEPLGALVRHEAAYRQVMLSLMVLMAGADGRVDRRERDLLRRTLDELGPDAATRAELCQAVEAPEETLFDALGAIGDEAFHELVLEILALTAVCDGRLVPAELDLLRRVSAFCGHPFDEGELRTRFDDFLRDTRRSRRRPRPERDDTA